MKIKHSLIILDRLICRYLGIKSGYIRPQTVELINDQIVIKNSEAYKRHLLKYSITQIDFNKISQEDRHKLGIATGKAIANNLVISFEQPPIREIKHAD